MRMFSPELNSWIYICHPAFPLRINMKHAFLAYLGLHTRGYMYCAHCTSPRTGVQISTGISFVPELQIPRMELTDDLKSYCTQIAICILLFYPRKYDYLVSSEHVLWFVLYQSGRKCVSREYGIQVHKHYHTLTTRDKRPKPAISRLTKSLVED